MKIVFVANSFISGNTGKGYWFHSVVKELRKRGMNVQVYARKVSGKKPKFVHYLFKEGNFFKLLKMLKEEDTVFHFPQYPTAVLGSFLRLFKKFPCVVGPNTIPGGYGPKTEKRPLLKKILVVLKNDKHVTISGAQVKTLGDFGVSKKKIELIKPGIELEKFKPKRSSLRKKIGIGEKDIVFIFIGRPATGGSAKIKQFWIFQEAAEEIAKNYKDAKFLVVGEKILPRTTRTPKMIFTGFVERGKLPDYYNAADVFVNTSRRETYAIAILEALSCGKPCIVTAVGGNKEQVVDGETGFFIKSDSRDLYKKMVYFVKNKKRLNTMSRNARRFAEKNFMWADKMDKLIKVYESVLNHYRKRRK